MSKNRRHSDEKVDKQSRDEHKFENKLKGAADRQRNKRIRRDQMIDE